ncbi:hypothetical protein ACXIZN_25375 [Amycolatopsis sp. TRM77291]
MAYPYRWPAGPQNCAAEASDAARRPDRPSGQRYQRHSGAESLRRCHDNGLLVLVTSSFGNVIRFVPPLSISDDLIREGLGVLGDAIADES